MITSCTVLKRFQLFAEEWTYAIIRHDSDVHSLCFLRGQSGQYDVGFSKTVKWVYTSEALPFLNQQTSLSIYKKNFLYESCRHKLINKFQWLWRAVFCSILGNTEKKNKCNVLEHIMWYSWEHKHGVDILLLQKLISLIIFFTGGK